MIEQAVRQKLRESQGLSSLVEDRIFPFAAPQGTGKVIRLVYFRVSTDRVKSQDGPSRLCKSRIQYDAWSPSYSDAKGIIDEVRLVIDGFQGTISVPDIGDFAVQSAWLDDDRDDFEQPDPADGGEGEHRVSADLMIAWVESDG